ncbi:MAG: O-acetyl-ADP-ribose deacetylase [Bacteroidota bacterium]
MKVEIIQADITKIKVDAIVNAANSSLLGGGGVDGAIHKAGGPDILEDCMKIKAAQGKCKTGDAVITRAGNLPANFVIHTVGPFYRSGGKKKRAFLKSCYDRSLELLVEKGLKTIAFPNISAGIYKFPKEEAAQIAMRTVFNHSLSNHIDSVQFVCFDDENYTIYKTLENEFKN